MSMNALSAFVLKTECRSCGNVSKTYETFTDLSLDFPEQYHATNDDMSSACMDACCLTGLWTLNSYSVTVLRMHGFVLYTAVQFRCHCALSQKISQNYFYSNCVICETVVVNLSLFGNHSHTKCLICAVSLLC